MCANKLTIIWENTMTYKDKGVLATLEIIIYEFLIGQPLRLPQGFPFCFSAGAAFLEPIVDRKHWSSSCFGDRRS